MRRTTALLLAVVAIVAVVLIAGRTGADPKPPPPAAITVAEPPPPTGTTEHDPPIPDTPVGAQTVPTGPTGRGGLARSLPLETPDGGSLALVSIDAESGVYVLTATPNPGTTTTPAAAKRLVRMLALERQDDPGLYRMTVPMTALKTYRNTPTERQPG